jgi:hypothetical protein
MIRDEKFGFLPRHSTSLQLAHLVERIIRNFGEKRLTGAVFLDATKAFDTVWINGLLYKLTILNFPSYLAHTISSYLRDRTFEASFQATTSSRRGMRAEVAHGRLISPVLLSACPHAHTLTPRPAGLLRVRHGHPRPVSRRCSSAAWNTSTTFNGGSVYGESP